MVRYPVTLERDDNDTWLVTFPDFPAQTVGDTKEEALARAPDALATVVDEYIRRRWPLPAPSRTTGERVELPAMMSAKVELYEAMLAMRISKSELGRRLKWHLPQVDRLFNLAHASKLDQIEAAAAALGGRLEMTLVGTSRSNLSIALSRSVSQRKRSGRRPSSR